MCLVHVVAALLANLSLPGAACWLQQAEGGWCADVEGLPQLQGSDVVRFPYAILEIKLQVRYGVWELHRERRKLEASMTAQSHSLVMFVAAWQMQPAQDRL
jgi:hypothetical protein